MKTHYMLIPNKKPSFITDSALASTLKLDENFAIDLCKLFFIQLMDSGIINS